MLADGYHYREAKSIDKLERIEREYQKNEEGISLIKLKALGKENKTS